MRHCRRAPPISSDDRSESPAMCRASSMARPAEMSSPATFSASGTVRTLWSMRMLASHNGYHSNSATWPTTSLGMLSCSSIRSRSEYGSSSPRPSPPVATIAKPLVAVMPISAAFVVSQNSCRSSSASRSAAESSWRAPPASSCSARRRSVAESARPGSATRPAAGRPPIGRRRRRDLVSALSFRVLPRPLPINAHGARPGDDVSFQLRLKGRRPPARRCGPGPRCRRG